MKTSLTHQLKQRRYADDLLARTLLAPCPRCGAKPGKRCASARGPHKGTHWARRNEAKRLKLIGGPWFDVQRWGATF